MGRRTVQGFAWMVFPDANPPDDETQPGRPFNEDVSEGGDMPPGVIDFWPLSAEMGLEDERTGVSLLVVTETPDPPPINNTYRVTPAELEEGYEPIGGLVRLVRLKGKRTTERGVIQEWVLEADDDTSLVGPEDRAGRTAGERDAPGSGNPASGGADTQ